MLFHVTKSKITPGGWLKAHGDTSQVRQDLQAANRWDTEVLMRDGHEDGWPPRIGGWYAAESKTFCRVYAESRNSCLPTDQQSLPWRYYLVEMQSPRRCPMVLVDYCRRLSEAGANVGPAISEYWTPDDGWKIYESLAVFMKVMEEVEPPGPEYQGAQLKYGNDLARAKRMFPLP